MKSIFYKELFDKHHQTKSVPSNQEIAAWGLQVISLLYPTQYKQFFSTVGELENEFIYLEKELHRILNGIHSGSGANNMDIAHDFFNDLPGLYRVLNTDISALLNGDPAARSEFEIIRAYPGFYAVSLYRIAHALLLRGIDLLPRILTEFAHSHTGIDIHPGAEIGEYLYIDHGTGIVIGETTRIGKHVKLYQGVTLGAMSVDKSMASIKRHPTVEDNVVIYSGATILGGETVIGRNSVIGGNVWLTRSVPPDSKVYNKPAFEVVQMEL
ncbi:MAG: serine O-acetyltransferase EpsC [Chitinophagaceae bacterium]